MTEEEAKEKMCPLSLGSTALQPRRETGYGGGGGGGGEQYSPPVIGGPRKCLASGCMAWRDPADGETVLPRGVHGYCGLAGRP